MQVHENCIQNSTYQCVVNVHENCFLYELLVPRGFMVDVNNPLFIHPYLARFWNQINLSLNTPITVIDFSGGGGGGGMDPLAFVIAGD